MSFSLDTNFVIAILFADAHTTKGFAWLRTHPAALCLSDWTATETFALVHRRVRSGLISRTNGDAALSDFDAFLANRASGLAMSSSAGALAAELARDPALKLSAADALHLAVAASGGHVLVTFDTRLANAAMARAYAAETP